MTNSLIKSSLVLILLTYSCGHEKPVKTAFPDSTKQNKTLTEQSITPFERKTQQDSLQDAKILSEFTFTIPNLDTEDFEVIEKGDSIFYTKTFYERLDGKQIQFDISVVTKITAKINFGFGFVQYTNDDNPAFPLQFTKRSEWANTDIDSGKIEVPDFFGNSKNTKVYEILGFKDQNMLINWVISNDFEKIKDESVKAQTDFYKTIIDKKNEYASCCPEYLKQAEEFLKQDPKGFKTIKELHLEFTYKDFILEISGETKDGTRFHKVIIEK
jgi:hypothetical protein